MTPAGSTWRALGIALRASIEAASGPSELARALADEARRAIWPLFVDAPAVYAQLAGAILTRARAVYDEPPADLRTQIEQFEEVTGASLAPDGSPSAPTDA